MKLFKARLQTLRESALQIISPCQLSALKSSTESVLLKLVSNTIPEKDFQIYLAGLTDTLIKDYAETSELEASECIEYFLDQNLLLRFIKLTSNNLGLKRRLVKFCTDLISNLDARFIGNQIIHSAVHELLQDKDLVDEIITLEHQITIKIFESPELLDLFFIPGTITSQSQFPIFDHLVQYIHLDGQYGDSARASFEILLLQCSQPQYECYLLQTEFASIVVSSLGGLYAQLPDKLPRIDKATGIDEGEEEIVYQKKFEHAVNEFLNFYQFFQNCLVKCASKELVADALAQFCSFFLDQVVMSFINSSSDFDGSTISALFYIQRLVDLTEHPRLFKLICRFLLDSGFDDGKEEVLSPRDILMSKLNSLSEDVVISILQLLTSLLQKDGHLALPLLLEMEIVNEDRSKRSTSNCSRLLGHFTKLLTNEPSPSTIDSYISDAITNSISKVQINEDSDDKTEIYEDCESSGNQESNSNVRRFLNKMDLFFSHSVKANIALTGLIIAIAQPENKYLTSNLFDPEIEGSLYTRIIELQKQIEGHKSTIHNYATRILFVRQSILGLKVLEDIDKSSPDGEILRNVVCLEEFIKEIIALLTIKAT